jgi:hypothetical protein
MVDAKGIPMPEYEKVKEHTKRLDFPTSKERQAAYDYKFTVFVPSTKNVSTKISASEWYDRIKETRTYLSKTFGGTTGMSVNWRCDHCGGEIQPLRGSPTGLRCTRCWQVTGYPPKTEDEKRYDREMHRLIHKHYAFLKRISQVGQCHV